MRNRPNMLGLVDPKDKSTYMENEYAPGFHKLDLPEGQSGDWAVQKYTVSEADVGLFNLRLIRDGMYRRILPPGTYTRLTHRGGVVMSDTPAEAWEHWRAYKLAEGNVLINGLGLGFFLDAILRKHDRWNSRPAVLMVTVIEKSPDVIKLVGPKFKDDLRVHIIEGDALTWKKPIKNEHWNFVWHDIWTDISDDNKAEMTKLRRRYARQCVKQAVWSEEYLYETGPRGRSCRLAAPDESP